MRYLSGIQPSGVLHIGNYFGAIRQHIRSQDEHDSYYFIADYHALKPDIRAVFDELEREFFAEAPGMKKASSTAKSEFVRDCWRRAEEVTDRLIADLERRNYFVEHVAYREMWGRCNGEGNCTLA